MFNRRILEEFRKIIMCAIGCIEYFGHILFTTYIFGSWKTAGWQLLT